MMKMKLTALAGVLALAGCLSEKTGTQPEARSGGRIQLVAMKGIAKASASQSGTHSFTLDTARTSFQQYFILQKWDGGPRHQLLEEIDDQRIFRGLSGLREVAGHEDEVEREFSVITLEKGEEPVEHPILIVALAVLGAQV
jgi:hypothetical protein